MKEYLVYILLISANVPFVILGVGKYWFNLLAIGIISCLLFATMVDNFSEKRRRNNKH